MIRLSVRIRGRGWTSSRPAPSLKRKYYRDNRLYYIGQFPCNYSARSVVQDNRKGGLRNDIALVLSNSSIIIEDVFCDHPSVLPAVGSIKKIDFFINGVPFDLKVTYLPEGYIKHCRRTVGKQPELTLLKQWARRYNVTFGKRLPDNRLLPDLWNKASDHPSAESLELLSELSDFRKQLINGAKSNPDTLIQWLYENQGVRRFDASNRLFLILVDCSNFFLSWKLKHAKPLLDSEISSYLDNVPSFPGRTLDFNWEGTNYTVVSDAIIITKP